MSPARRQLYVSSCQLPQSVLTRLVGNVFVEKFQLVSLLAELNSQQVANREHANPPFLVYDWKVTTSNQFHSFEGLMGCFIASDDGAEVTGDFTNLQQMRVASLYDDSIQDVAFREDAH